MLLPVLNPFINTNRPVPIFISIGLGCKMDGWMAILCRGISFLCVFFSWGKKVLLPLTLLHTYNSSVFFFSLCVGISFIKERTSPCVTGELVEMPLNLKCNMCSYKFTEKNNSITNLAIPLKLSPTAIQKSRFGCVHNMCHLK